jgi:hypothetical protein
LRAAVDLTAAPFRTGVEQCMEGKPMTATKDKFFNPTKLSAQDKAAATDKTARSIIAAELSERERKTERLKALRLQQEAAAADAAPAPKKSARQPKSAAKA